MKERVGFEFALESDVKWKKTVKNRGLPLQAADPRADERGDLPGGMAHQEDFVRSSQLLIYSEVNGCTSQVCAISCQARTTAFPRVVLAGTVLQRSGGQFHGDNCFSTGTSCKYSTLMSLV